MYVVRRNGISFVSIDESLPLSEQGPFDVILHKITSKEWQQVLEVRSCHIDLNVFCLIFFCVKRSIVISWGKLLAVFCFAMMTSSILNQSIATYHNCDTFFLAWKLILPLCMALLT